MNVVLRRATTADVGFLFFCRNDPVTIAMSRTQRAVTVDEHADWTRVWIEHPSPNRVIYVAIDADHETALDDGRIGTGRLDYDSDVTAERPTCEVSVTVHPMKRRHGYGAAIVSALVNEAMKRTGNQTIFAECRRENTASIAAFERNGFVESPFVRLEWTP